MRNNRDENEMTLNKEYVKWDDIEEFITYLEKNIDLSKFTGVYGPARGGVCFAAIISNRYNLPYLGAPQKGCLCIDDICDSGDTSLAWKEKGYTIATMYYKKNKKVLPDIYWKEKKNEWIIFPWEEDNRNK